MNSTPLTISSMVDKWSGSLLIQRNMHLVVRATILIVRRLQTFDGHCNLVFSFCTFFRLIIFLVSLPFQIYVSPLFFLVVLIFPFLHFFFSSLFSSPFIFFPLPPLFPVRVRLSKCFTVGFQNLGICSQCLVKTGRNLCGLVSASQSIYQPDNQPINQPINPSTNRSFHQ